MATGRKGSKKYRNSSQAKRNGSHSNTSSANAIVNHELDWPETVKWWALYLFVLIPVRMVFGVLLPPILQYVWHNGSVFHLAQDDHPVYARVRQVGWNVRYGTHRRETFDLIVPDAKRRNLGGEGKTWLECIEAIVRTLLDLITCYPRAALAWCWPSFFGISNEFCHKGSQFPAIMFVHGGGYTAVDPTIQHHQCTAFARQGFAVYCPAYPWAPEDPHPQQLLSGLRFLKWLKSEHKHNSVSLVGESAGGNMVTLLAALLANPPLLRNLAITVRDVHKLTNEDISTWSYPTIQSVVSWYGILDRESWQDKGFLSWGLSWTVDAHRMRAPAWFASQRERAIAAQNCSMLTITDLCLRHRVLQYPPIFIIAGSTDPLGLLYSSRRARDVLKESIPHLRGLEYEEYEAGHAFIGLNPFVLIVLHGKAWREKLALPATQRSIDFIKNHHH